MNKQVTALTVMVAGITYLLASLVYRPIVCSDALNGMVSLGNYLKGAQWNTTLSLSAGNTAIATRPLTWWAPGQYQIPFLLSRLCPVSIGTAISILLFVSLLGGAYFYYRLLRLSVLSERAICASLLILVLQRFMNIFFVQYSSPDLYLFLLTPLYAYSYLRLPENGSPSPLSLALLLVLNLAGLFIKNSFVLFELAFNFFLLIDFLLIKRRSDSSTGTVVKAMLLLLPFALANVLNYIYFLRLGINPAQGNGLSAGFRDILTGIFTPVIQALFGSLSLSAAYGNLYKKISIVGPWDLLLMLSFLLAGCFILYKYRAQLIRLFKQDRVFRMAVTGMFCYAACWLAFTVRRSAVSAEDRLFLPVSIFIFPYMVRAASNAAAPARYLFGLCICLSVLFGGYTFVNRVQVYAVQGAVPSEGKSLTGFRVYGDEQDSKSLRTMSLLIASSCNNDAVFVLDPALAFRLQVQNKFIVASSLPAASRDGTAAPYALLLEDGPGIPPPGLKKVGSSGKFSLYQSAR